MWNDELHFFCDIDKDGNLNDYMGIGGFITGLFANQVYRPGGLATKEQAERLAQWCAHPDFSIEVKPRFNQSFIQYIQFFAVLQIFRNLTPQHGPYFF